MHELELSKKFAPLVLLFYPDRNMDLGTPEEVLTDEALENILKLKEKVMKKLPVLR